MRAKVVATIVLLTLLVIFAIQKTQPVVLNFLSWKISTSFLLYILLGFMIGLLTGYLLIMMVRMKKKNLLRQVTSGYRGQIWEEGPSRVPSIY